MNAHFTFQSIPARIKEKGRHMHVPYLLDTAAFCNHPNILDVCRRLLLSPIIKILFFRTEFRGLHVTQLNVKQRTCNVYM